jgi:hypothetical protein
VLEVARGEHADEAEEARGSKVSVQVHGGLVYENVRVPLGAPRAAQHAHLYGRGARTGLASSKSSAYSSSALA